MEVQISNVGPIRVLHLVSEWDNIEALHLLSLRPRPDESDQRLGSDSGTLRGVDLPMSAGRSSSGEDAFCPLILLIYLRKQSSYFVHRQVVVTLPCCVLVVA
jgi:hypothetical protein